MPLLPASVKKEVLILTEQMELQRSESHAQIGKLLEQMNQQREQMDRQMEEQRKQMGQQIDQQEELISLLKQER